MAFACLRLFRRWRVCDNTSALGRVYIEYLGDSIELPLGETVVGRDVGCALRFNDPSVSRRHLRFIRREGEVFLEDLKSSNGTLLNGRAITAAIHVREGDIISVGSRELIVRMPQATEEPDTILLRLAARSTPSFDRQIVRAVTAQIPVTMPPPLVANQRCPQCGAAVSGEDDECERCQYRWGTFRPASVTDVRKNPLNRRRHERRSIELHLVYVSSELEIEATTRDLSESGVFVCSEVLDPIGTECQLTILVDGGPPLSVKGVVRRVIERQETAESEPAGLGIEFVQIPPAERAWLKTTVDRMVQAELAALGDD
ncbi:MAG: hypothetical protein JWO36_2674 [Myxococcales bacterium]|nr:hypothetical protein [Myxococcales bacterium]